MPYRISLLTESDLPEYFIHCLKVASQSGVDGLPIHHPFDERTPFKNPDPQEFASKFRLPTDSPGWKRTFGLFNKGQLIGDLDFYGKPLASALHRVTIGMGLQRAHVGKGLGTRLLQHGIDWARSQPSIEYVDLRVFSSNLPAIGLYRKLGFSTVGSVPDAFRIRGQKLDDIHMSLKLR